MFYRVYGKLDQNTQIANGKAYHDACLRGSGLKKWKSWANKQKQFKMLLNTMLTRISTFVNHCWVCYDRWDDIVRNLSDPRFSDIEPSTLSVHYLQQAASRTWCEKYNDAVLTQRGQRGDLLYTSERDEQILQMVVNSGIFGELRYNLVMLHLSLDASSTMQSLLQGQLILINLYIKSRI